MHSDEPLLETERHHLVLYEMHEKQVVLRLVEKDSQAFYQFTFSDTELLEAIRRICVTIFGPWSYRLEGELFPEAFAGSLLNILGILLVRIQKDRLAVEQESKLKEHLRSENFKLKNSVLEYKTEVERLRGQIGSESEVELRRKLQELELANSDLAKERDSLKAQLAASRQNLDSAVTAMRLALEKKK